MSLIKTKIGRRSFLKASALTSGGLLIGFNWLTACGPMEDELVSDTKWTDINAYLKIGENGVVTIISPNPEGGQNVKTSMPMIVAEELDVDWKNVIVEQAPLNTESFTRQFIGGSQAIRRSWKNLRVAGASARQMLKEAAAKAWDVPVEEITTSAGILHHKKSNTSAGYGELATAAATIPVPEEVNLKEAKDFTIIGTSRKNVDGAKIVTGKPLFGIDTHREGMLIAMIMHPPAFGMKLKSFDDTVAREMPGIKDIFVMNIFDDTYEKQRFDTCSFPELVAVVGTSTWEVLQAKKALQIIWESTGKSMLESTADHLANMAEMSAKSSTVIRQDGDPQKAFKNAKTIIERTYTAPFLAHNCMEPMNFFAHVTADKAEFIGPLQKPEFTELAVSARLGIPVEKIDINMTRLGGGFGRRSYAHFMIEAGIISQKMNAPVKLIYTREDDMTAGIYRPTYQATYRAGLDADNTLIAFHVKAGGIPESPLHANRFPAGAVDNYLAEEWTIDSDITIGSFRAPRSNFIAGAEQSFLDEIAETIGKDPIEFRLELLARAQTNPVGENNDYEADRYASVLKLVREKSGWGQEQPGIHRGVAAYFCHNSYAAQVLDMNVENGKPTVAKVTCAIDCGIVVNPDAAKNLTEGAIVDGIGNALYGGLTFKDGVPDKSNFDKYRLIRHQEAPKAIDVHFVQNEIDPTGLGEPAFPPTFGAVANALYRATGKRFYSQPFGKELENAIQPM